MASLRDHVTDTQRAAARALIEGEAPTHARIAACMGVNVTTVSHWASEGDWAALDFRNARVRKAHRGVIALAKALRAGEEPDPLAALDEAERDALANAGLDEDAALPDGPVDPDVAAVNELASLPHDKRVARISSILTRRIETILVGVEAGRVVETRQVLALNALVQLAERITVLSPQEQVWQERRTEAELGALYERIENRIEELAHLYAADMLANGDKPKD